jgi:hypothetical protein
VVKHQPADMEKSLTFLWAATMVHGIVELRGHTWHRLAYPWGKFIMRKLIFTLALTFALLFTLASAQQTQVMPVLFLNGTGAYAELPGPVTDNLVNATIECWVLWESLHKWSRVFDFGKEGNAAVLQNERETPTLFFSVWDRSGKMYRAEGLKAIETGKWQHMAIVSGKAGMQLYVNGERIGENAYVMPFSAISGGRNYLGRSNWPDAEPFHGFIADFRVWATARTASEIRQTMFTQLKGDESGLAGSYVPCSGSHPAFWRGCYERAWTPDFAGLPRTGRSSGYPTAGLAPIDGRNGTGGSPHGRQ